MEKKVVVFGATNLDISCTSKDEIVKCDSNPGDVKFSFGGVGHNIALNLKLLNQDVHFVTPVGNDIFSKTLEEHLKKYFYSEDIIYTKSRSGVYVSVHSPSGEMEVGVNDMSINEELNSSDIKDKEELIKDASFLILDSNMSSLSLMYVTSITNAFIASDCVSTKKAEKLIPILDRLDIIKPNLLELEHLSGIKVVDHSSLDRATLVLLDKGVKGVLVTLGKDGSYFSSKDEGIYLKGCKTEVVNATGAGDSFLSGFMDAIIDGENIDEALKEGTVVSLKTLNTKETVCLDLNKEYIKNKTKELEDVEVFRHF